MPAPPANTPRAAGPLWAAASYALGCANAAYYLLHARRGADIRAIGSGNAGARNAGRALGPGGFLAVLALDAAKGIAAVAVARRMALGERGAGASLVAVVAGHVWPAQLGFRGGKGLATGVGGMAVLDGPLALATVLATAGLAGLTRRGNASAIGVTVAVPVMALVLRRPAARVGWLAALSSLVLLAHRREIHSGAARLLARGSAR